ncbi:hypothetical protein BJX63DRAFT_380636 [Aspergillus granulosus]|uniref:Required for respiratory growth protein 9, mitochondrial n=1 Tax=Aspergillus granulosus TaxID=176169 RepID=A0ABR4HY10_9EURO
MMRICPSSAGISFPNAVRTLVNVPAPLQLRAPSIRFANQLSLPSHTVRSIITVGDIPVTTFAEPESSKPAEKDSSALAGSTSARNHSPSQNAPKTAKPHSSVREKTKINKPASKPKSDRKGTGGTKKAEKEDKKNGPMAAGSLFKKKKLEDWQIQKEVLQKKFPTGWSPQKKLSPDAMEGIRHLHATSPNKFTTAVLAEEFKVSPEAVRRILKSKWRPNATEMEDRRKRWEKRHDRIWGHLSELGLRPHTQRTAHLSDAQKVLYGDNSKP